MGLNEEGRSVNVNKPERIASIAAGATMGIYALKKPSWGNAVVGLIGGYLVFRGLTGNCPAYSAIGIDKSSKDESVQENVPGHGGILVQKSVTIDKPASELYTFWRAYENLPQFMNHLEAVTENDAKVSHWVAKAPLGTSVEWDAETIRDNENELIAWRSLPGAQVENSGSVRFIAASDGHGTEVKVTLEYQPPAGALGAVVAKLFGEEPSIQIEEDLNRFKQLMETGEVATIEGQSHDSKGGD